ncbi:MAG: glycine cleavage system H protein [Clostridia bacterium]|nr:glycine cleavage system H protein [Clostridia bacterium]
MEFLGYEFPEDLLYDNDLGWVKEEGAVITVGISDFFQKTAGEIIFIEIPVVGRKVEKGQPFASIESGKWVGRLKAPVNGEITEVNSELSDFPYLLDESPYQDGWIAKIKVQDKGELQALHSPQDKAAFEQFVQAEKDKYQK